jgi:hypothetical protein
MSMPFTELGLNVWAILIAPCMLSLPIFVLIQLILGKRRQHQYIHFLEYIRAAWIFSLMLGMIAGTGATAMLFEILWNLPGKYLNWLALAVLPLGYGTYHFKNKNQLLYGTVEVLMGVATALGATARPEFHATQGLTTIGAIYIVARGFNNISEARQKAVGPPLLDKHTPA